MLGGESSSVGFVFYDTEKKNENAVFCRYEGETPVFKTGEKDELFKEMRKLDEPFSTEENDPVFKILGLEISAFAAIIAAVWVFIGGFFPILGSFIFAAAAFLPVLILIYTVRSLYPEKSILEQFKRFHGAEHIAVELFSENKKVPVPEDFIDKSPYHKECGTVYSASAVIFSAVFGISLGLIPKIGFFWFLGIVFITALALFFNFLNPFNPLMFFQRYTVQNPTEKEILLACEGIKILSELE